MAAFAAGRRPVNPTLSDLARRLLGPAAEIREQTDEEIRERVSRVTEVEGVFIGRLCRAALRLASTLAGVEATGSTDGDADALLSLAIEVYHLAVIRAYAMNRWDARLPAVGLARKALRAFGLI